MALNTVNCMINKFIIDGVPVTMTMNKTGDVTEATVGERGQYLIEPRGNSWHVTFMQQGDYRVFRSSNCYSERYSGESDLNVIIDGLVNDGYFPDCPEWVKLNSYTPDFNAPILSRVWYAPYQKDDRLRDKRLQAWDREVRDIVKDMPIATQALFRALGEPAVEMLNILETVLHEFVGLRSIDMTNLPEGLEDGLSEEEHLLCVLYLDIANEISLSNDGFLIDPEWEDPIPHSSCYLEDIISL